MKQYLIPEGGRFYKVNLHSHSTLSDGRQTPEELKEAYKAKVYSAIAYTEHGKLYDLSHLNDEEFIAITSYEMDFLDKKKPAFTFYEGTPTTWSHAEAVHMNLYSKDPHKTEAVDIKDLKEMDFSVENINEAIRRAKAEGFLVCYNHPNWSLNTYPLYSRLEGLDGLEIVNGASDRTSDLEYTPYVYDQMSRAGIRMNCYGGDDNHGTRHFFHGWTMVKAEALTYDCLLGAIEKGDCYASSGPEIYDLYVENGAVTVHCSDAYGIFYTTAGRSKQAALDETFEHPLRKATFKISPNDLSFRITVRDKHGFHANTRIYYLDEIELPTEEAK